MRLPHRTLLLSATLLLCTSACALHDSYAPALPVERTVLESPPASPAEVLLPPAPPRPLGVPSPEEWTRWQQEGEALQKPVPIAPKQTAE